MVRNSSCFSRLETAPLKDMRLALLDEGGERIHPANIRKVAELLGCSFDQCLNRWNERFDRHFAVRYRAQINSLLRESANISEDLQCALRCATKAIRITRASGSLTSREHSNQGIELVR